LRKVAFLVCVEENEGARKKKKKKKYKKSVEREREEKEKCLSFVLDVILLSWVLS
jgi:hypothetical protein